MTQTTLHLLPEISAKILSNLLARVPEHSHSLQPAAAPAVLTPCGRAVTLRGRAARAEPRAAAPPAARWDSH